MRHSQLVVGPLSWRSIGLTRIGALACNGPDDLTALGSWTSLQIFLNKAAVKVDRRAAALVNFHIRRTSDVNTKWGRGPVLSHSYTPRHFHKIRSSSLLRKVHRELVAHTATSVFSLLLLGAGSL